MLWTFLGQLTHNSCVVPIDDQSDIIVVEQGSDVIVLLSPDGKEFSRIRIPTFNSIEISIDPVTNTVTFCIMADKIYCYSLAKNLLGNKKK